MAEAAAALAHHLLSYARVAVGVGNGLCREYRGDFPLGDQGLAS